MAGSYPVAEKAAKTAVLEKLHAGYCLFLLDLTGVFSVYVLGACASSIQRVQAPMMTDTDAPLFSPASDIVRYITDVCGS